MADDGENGDLSPQESMLQRQKKEKKDIQAQIQKLKHSIPKGDKRKKKEVTAQVAMMEAELDAKHEQELNDLSSNASGEAVAAGIDSLSVNAEESAGGGEPKEKKMSKAQKRREKKAQQDKEREQRILEQEKDNEFGVRNVEATKLKALLKSRNLVVHEIPSDGNCLYSAIEHQLGRNSISTNVPSLRKQTADLMRSNSDDYLPFLCKQDTGDPYSLEEYNDYCHKLETTPEWGGQLEITAMAHALRNQIEVIQADGPSIIVGEDYGGQPILLSYHRHAYKLGEHYNSVVPKSVENDSEEEFS